MRTSLRLVHTSDLHLGIDGRRAGEGLAPLEAVAEAVAKTGAHLVLLCGDIFDSNRVSDQVIRDALGLLGQIGVPSIILPGNHDCHGHGSVYLRAEAMGLPPQVHVLTPQRQQVVLPELDVSVWGRPHVDYRDLRPLHHPPSRGGQRWHIALAHGHLVRQSWDLERSYLIFPQEIAESGAHYVALGHWELPYDASAGTVVAAYSGSPQMARQVLVVELDHQVRVRRHPLGRG